MSNTLNVHDIVMLLETIESPTVPKDSIGQVKQVVDDQVEVEFKDGDQNTIAQITVKRSAVVSFKSESTLTDTRFWHIIHDSRTKASEDDDAFIGGIVGGYDWDLGQAVLGVGLDLDYTDISLGAVDIDRIFRLKARAGYKIGRGLLYATAGYANADGDNFGDDDGYFVGAGYEHLVTDRLSIGTEVLYHEFNNFGSSDIDVETTTVQVRATYRF